MSPVKQNTTELFFPLDDAAKTSDAIPVPTVDSLTHRVTSQLSHLGRVFWSIVTFITTMIILFYAAADMGIIPPALFEQFMPVDRLYTVESRRCSLEQIDRRLQIIESRLDSVQIPPSFQLNTLSSHLEATEAYVRSISTILEGAQPRNVALWADGARHVKALTSPTYKPRRSSLFQYFWHSKGITVPPSHVLNGAPTSYCWEFAGSTGQFAARLSEQSQVASISIFHAHRRTLSSVAASKAPKMFILWGLYSETASIPPGTIWKPVSDFFTLPNPPPGIQHSDRLVFLANGTYDQVSSRTRQHFNIPSPLPPVDVVVLEILNNWGSNTTCLYGFGVHIEPIE